MKPRRKVPLRKVLLVFLGIVLLATLAVVLPRAWPPIKAWWTGKTDKDQGTTQADLSHELVRDAQGRPITPPTMRLSPRAAEALKVATEKVTPAGPLLLPKQIGTVGYDTDRLYPVRPRFQGEIIKIAQVSEYHVDASLPSEKRVVKRMIGPGDRVHKGEELAVIWSKELGDRKVALVTALLDLYVDEETLKQQEPIYEKGSLPEATIRASRGRVQKDLAAVYAAESALGISRLLPEEVEKIRQEARVIQKRLQGNPETPEQRKQRMSEDVQKWARVELVAPQDGIIVQKDTNVNDIVDPARDTPLFRIADLRSLLVYMNFNEEYLPLLQPLMRFGHPGTMRWKLRLEAEPDIPVLDLPILRIAPSLDPNAHTAMVIGRIANPIKVGPSRERYLLVGQFVTATVEVPPPEGTVAMPTNGLNEVNGQSLVFVQRDSKVPEYTLRRIAVVRRSRDVTLVRSQLTEAEQEASEEEVRQGRRPIETLQVGELVVTHGITEMTDALEALLAESRATK
jgi:cobalt-zinc-cadmium efflux system membrane fusion protein